MKIKNWTIMMLAVGQVASLVLVVGGIVGAIKYDAIFSMISALGVLVLVGLRVAVEDERRLRLVQERWSQEGVFGLDQLVHQGVQEGTASGPVMDDLPPIDLALAVAEADFRVRYETAARDVKRMRMAASKDVQLPPIDEGMLIRPVPVFPEYPDGSMRPSRHVEYAVDPS